MSKIAWYVNLMETAPLPSGPQANIPDEAWVHVRNALIRFFLGKLFDPEDCTQETLTRVTAWLATGKPINGDNGFEKLCFGFARNVLREYRTRQQRTHTQLLTDVPVGENRTRGMNSVDSSVFLDQALGRVSSYDRKLILDAENLSQDELAKTYHTSKETVAVWVFRARERLRTQLRSMGGL